jgi:glycosyltransferase involved in cell wall biosynthesis
MQLARCMLSVAQQAHRPVEHVIVSDGPDSTLTTSPAARSYTRQLTLTYPGYQPLILSLQTHNPDEWWGRRAKIRAAEAASGDLICCLDDDDTITPAHLTALHAALEAAPDAGFAFTAHVIGPPFHPDAAGFSGRPDRGTLFTPGVMLFRRALLDIASWRHVDCTPEWDMAERWIAAGVRWAAVPQASLMVYQHEDYTRDGYPPGRCNDHLKGA